MRMVSVWSYFLYTMVNGVCDTDAVVDSLLLCIGLYFVLNLNYPKQYAQFLGFIQVTCLKQDFHMSQRTTQFVKLKESLRLWSSV